MKFFNMVITSVLLFASVSVSALTLEEGHSDMDDLMMWRARSFISPSNQPEMYVGVPNLNNPNNRGEADIIWNLGGSSKITLTYDRNADTLIFQTDSVDETAIAVYENWSEELSGSGITPEQLNAMNLTIFGRDNGAEVVMRDVKLNGFPIRTDGPFGVYPNETPTMEMYTITGSCFGVQSENGFVLEAFVDLGINFGNDVQLSKIDFSVGFADMDSLPCPGIIFKDSFEG